MQLKPDELVIDTENPFKKCSFARGDICHFQVLLFFSSNFSGKLICDAKETLQLKWHHPRYLADLKTLPNMLSTINAFLIYEKSGKFQTI